MDDHTSIIKALAKLVSHQVAVDLSPIYSPILATTNQNKATIRTVTLGGNSITAAILSEENRKLFQNLAEKLRRDRSQRLHQNIPFSQKVANTQNISSSLNQPAELPMKNIIEHGFQPQEQLQFSESTTTQQTTPKSISSSPATNHEFGNTISMFDVNQSQYQKLTANNSRITKSHTAFLQARQDFSKQMSEIIQLQLVCAENLLNEEAE